MSESDINNLCNLMTSIKFTRVDLKTIKDVYYDIKNDNITGDTLEYYLYENDILIQEMMECIDLREIEFLYDMMDQYINICNPRQKLFLLFKCFIRNKFGWV